MTAVDDFLDALDGTTIPYVEVTEDAQQPYCDSCTEPIRPNREVQLYGVNKLLTGHSVPNGFRTLRLHCEECILPTLHLACQGYAEYLIDATVDPHWAIRDPSIREVSPESDGIDYEPTEILERLFGMPYSQLMAATGGEAQGPLDAVDVLILTGIDPRDVINAEGEVTLTASQREQFAEEAMAIFEKHENGEGPPQPSVSEKLRGYFGGE